MMIDYVDFVELGHTMFVSGLGAAPVVQLSDLGGVIAHVKCSLTPSDHRRLEPPTVDGTAAFLPVGTPLQSVRGYPPLCRVAAVVDGQIHVYLAQYDVSGHSQPLPCALSPTVP